ncbi:DUF4097 family beta strand repeat-containing protein [Shewanella pneumatophori]|uniref:DUF4097 family beta strand repeat-containing protein n=1 Tax=Shewanella pneumatophori TaxID=314092 RepID=A0A9X2CH03_9GAMM|nr:DUF4097 family beta strand repeat-containing protein [Shewanella pneumatophori]MCL1137959.1 DUF4097 family beta strand repeat-containing protein [Shewanella pneumatophori]
MTHKLISALTISTLLLCQSAFAAERIQQQQSVQADPSVKVKVQRGNVTFKSWDKNEIAVSGTLDELSQGFIFNVSGNKVTIEDKLPRQYSGSNKDGSVLTITLPSQLKLHAEGVSADYALDSLAGKLNISSVSGNIKANNLQQKAALQTVSGDILSRSLSGKVSLQTVSGDIKDTQSSGSLRYQLVSGELTADTQANKVSVESVSGDATIALANVDSLNIKTVSGDLELSLNTLTESATLGSVSGDIEIKFLSAADVNVDINGGPGGKIINKLTNDLVSKAKYSPQSYLKFQTGNGNAELNVSTISGKIELAK